MRRYLVQLTTFLAPRSVDVADSTLRQLAGGWWRRPTWRSCPTSPGPTSRTTRCGWPPSLAAPVDLAKNTQRQRLRMIRIFFERSSSGLA